MNHTYSHETNAEREKSVAYCLNIKFSAPKNLPSSSGKSGKRKYIWSWVPLTEASYLTGNHAAETGRYATASTNGICTHPSAHIIYEHTYTHISTWRTAAAIGFGKVFLNFKCTWVKEIKLSNRISSAISSQILFWVICFLYNSLFLFGK